ncbi:MAG: chaperone protein HscB [Ferruginibacter sp.]|nr:chaperone protein HscB [Ferruginibacter sp.]
MNYFDLFGIPMAPVIDKTMLAKKYFELQRASHPDFFSNENEATKEDALQASADINKAFKIFQHPDRTLEYFLREKGIIATDEKYELPPAFLMEMMELNEGLMEDSPADSEAKISSLAASLSAEVKPILDSYDADKTTAAELAALKAYYYKKKYLKRILERLAD